MKKSPKKLNGKNLTRLVTAFVFLLSMGVVAATTWFFASTLSEVARTQRGDSSRTVKMEGIDGTLLEELVAFHKSRAEAPKFEPSRHANPFVPVATFASDAEAVPVIPSDDEATAPPSIVP